MRYSTKRPPPPGKQQRGLLRPVYWLGNWQFACLGYYEPPKRHAATVAVAAEPFPPVLARLRRRRSSAACARGFPPATVPRRWHLNTCLVNFYGNRIEAGKAVDAARVGEHRDFEPGPVASLSLGERARFQFVRRGATRDAPPVRTQWLEDGSLQIFGGPRWKDDLLHRVQRVDDKHELDLPPQIDGFRTRRVNFTFRYVPDEHVVAVRAAAGRARATTCATTSRRSRSTRRSSRQALASERIRTAAARCAPPAARCRAARATVGATCSSVPVPRCGARRRAP